MGAKVTIKDVAELAGVSKSTVSRYLNHGYISLEKQQRVREAIEKTGFKSNFFAKRLKTQESKLIGIDWTRASWPRHVFHAPIGFYQCLLNDSSFFGLNLDELRIEACKEQDLDFREGHFCRANFRDTDLARSLFGNTHLIGADFT